MMAWSTVAISKVCGPTEQRDPGCRPSTKFHYVDIAGIDRVHKKISEHQTILGADAPSRARKIIREDDILVSTVRPNLNAVAMVPARLDGHIASTGFCVLRPKRKIIEPQYLFYCTIRRDFAAALSARVRGANYPAVSDNDVKGLQIPLPTLSEQRHIVGTLEQADKLRYLRTEADAKANRIIPAFFIKMFGNPSTNPMGWTSRPLGDITDHLTSGSRGWAKYTGRGEAHFVRTQNIEDGEISPRLLRIDPPGGAESERTRLAVGDVVVTITGVVGKAAVVRDNSRKLYVSQHVALIRPRQSVLLSEYLAAYANLPLGHTPLLVRFQYGQTKPGLSFRELKMSRIPIPPIDLQSAFAEQTKSIRRLQSPAKASRRTLKSLWNTVLHRAFSADLTASWREAHMKELVQEMTRQAKALKPAAAP